MTEEIWLPVVGYEGLYEVSSLGAVRRVDRFTKTGKLIRGRVLKVRPLPSGRPRVGLCKEGRVVDAYPYRLVLEAFVGPCPPGMEALHWDDDHSNNAIENLRWGTRTDNMRGHVSERERECRTDRVPCWPPLRRGKHILLPDWQTAPLVPNLPAGTFEAAESAGQGGSNQWI